MPFSLFFTLNAPASDTVATWYKSGTYNPISVLMQYLHSCNIKVVLSVFLLIIQFVARQFINKEWDLEKFISSLCEFPINIIFLSLSLLTALLIHPSSTWANSFLAFVLFFLLSIIIVALARYTVKKYTKNANFTWGLAACGALNYFMAFSALLFTFDELSK